MIVYRVGKAFTVYISDWVLSMYQESLKQRNVLKMRKSTIGGEQGYWQSIIEKGREQFRWRIINHFHWTTDKVNSVLKISFSINFDNFLRQLFAIIANYSQGTLSLSLCQCLCEASLITSVVRWWRTRTSQCGWGPPQVWKVQPKNTSIVVWTLWSEKKSSLWRHASAKILSVL